MDDSSPLTPEPALLTNTAELGLEASPISPVIEPKPEAAFSPTAQVAAAPQVVGPSRQTLVIALVAVFFFAAGLLVGGLLLGGSNGVDTQELAELVRSVVADEVSKVAGGDSGSNTALINNISDDPSFGPEDAPITIVEFSDFYCPFCGRFSDQTLPQIRTTYGDKVKFVYRDMPIIGGQISVEAAVAANCANAQGKFWEFHDIIYANNDARERAAFIAFAGELSLDTTAFEVCLDDPAQVDEVRLDLLDGQGLGISGTPAFYINGRFVSGAQPFETFALVIDAELRKLGLE